MGARSVSANCAKISACARQGALEAVLVLGLPAAAADEEEHLPGRRIHVRRTHQDQLVLPRNLAPGLGRQDELGNLGGANTSRLHFAPRITRVRRSDVAGELPRGFGACARRRDHKETGRERREAARNVHERMLGAAGKGRRAQRRDSHMHHGTGTASTRPRRCGDRATFRFTYLKRASPGCAPCSFRTPSPTAPQPP